MKWMVVCLYLSSCGTGYQVSNHGVFPTKEACETRLAKDNEWLQQAHAEQRQQETFSFYCVEINP